MLRLEMQDAEAEMKWTLREMPPWDANAERAEQLSHDNFPPKRRRIIKGLGLLLPHRIQMEHFLQTHGQNKDPVCTYMCCDMPPSQTTSDFYKDLKYLLSSVLSFRIIWAEALRGKKESPAQE